MTAWTLRFRAGCARTCMLNAEAVELRGLCKFLVIAELYRLFLLTSLEMNS